jgi:hypothetical protein
MTEMTANLLTREQAIEAAAEVQVSRAYAEQVDLRIGEGDQMFDSRNPFHYLRCGASALMRYNDNEPCWCEVLCTYSGLWLRAWQGYAVAACCLS